MSSKNLVRISAAGSGKTWQICHDALSAAYKGESSLITTYTNKGVDSVKEEVCRQNRGVLHENVTICSWYQFLLSELIKPYQTVIANINEIKGYDFSDTYGVINYQKAGSKKRYIRPDGRVISNTASELVLEIVRLSNDAPIKRLEKCFDQVFIDEIQDLAGSDLDIVQRLLKSEINITCSGDNKQATYKTHNAKKNKAKSGANIWKFFNSAEENGLVTIEHNLISKRCNKEICAFANTVFSNENNMSSQVETTTGHDGVFLIQQNDVDSYANWYSPQVLRYDIKTDVRNYRALNFGQCKGMTFNRVMIFPNNPLKEFVFKRKALKSPYKYYVGVTRSKFSLAIVIEDISKCSDSFVDVQIPVERGFIGAKKFLW